MLPRGRLHGPASDRGFSFRQAALIDAAHDAYADWLEASFGVERLYAGWCDATRAERALAFAAYAAALEREERAAQVFADVATLARRVCAG
jgi:hypothetical protein